MGGLEEMPDVDVTNAGSSSGSQEARSIQCTWRGKRQEARDKRQETKERSSQDKGSRTSREMSAVLVKHC